MSLVSHSGSGMLAMTLNKFELMSSSIKGEEDDSVECNKSPDTLYSKYIHLKSTSVLNT